MKKYLLPILFMPLFAQANQVNLDSLVTSNNNFCNQGQEGKLTGILSFFNLNKDSDIYFKGLKVSRIEIKNPIIQTQFTPEKIQKESRQYINTNTVYPFKNLYSIGYAINLTIDGHIDTVKAKIDNINGNYAFKKFGQYNPAILSQSKTLEEFEKNLKTIQVPEYSVAIMANYETNIARTSLIYQCKMVAYTSDNVATITSKANQ